MKGGTKISLSDTKDTALQDLFREWSEQIETMEHLDIGKAALLDSSVSKVMEIERTIMRQPADTMRAMAIKIIVAARAEGTALGENMTALVAEARAILNS